MQLIKPKNALARTLIIFSFLAILWISLWASPALAQNDSVAHLDQLAIQDAHMDLRQQPRPGYAYDHYSVFRMPVDPPAGLIIIGDSILTGWSGYFAHVFPNAIIDGKVGRQFSAAIPIWEQLQQEGLTKRVGYVVLELGTNGEVSPADMQNILDLLGNRQVFLVVPEMPRPWEKEVQTLYYQTASQYPNVHLVYWNLLSHNHPGYYWKDRVHPNWRGIQVMAQAIGREILSVFRSDNQAQ